MRWSRRRDTLWFCFVYLSISPTKLNTKPKKGTFCRLWWRVCQQHQVLKSETGRERKKCFDTIQRGACDKRSKTLSWEEMAHLFCWRSLIQPGKKEVSYCFISIWMNPIPTVDYWDRILYPLLFEKRLPTPTSTKTVKTRSVGYDKMYLQRLVLFYFIFTKDSYDSARLEVN